MDCIAWHTDRIRADLLVVSYDQYLLAQIEERKRLHTAL